MIFITNLAKTLGKRDLFSNVSVTIDRGEKIGLVGPNGAGKSTLFSIILGKTESSSGNIQINKNVRIGHLAQESTFTSSATVLSEVTSGDAMLKNLLDEKTRLEQEHKAADARYGEILHELEFLDYFQLEHKAKKILSGLGFKEEDFNRPISNLSGGWQMRALLAKLLTLPYDLLLLDEPTNFLDLNAALWLKDFLAEFSGSFIMISHDRDFLDDVTTYTLVLEHGEITKVKGNYEQYAKIHDERRRHLLKKFNEIEKKREQLQRFIDRFHGQPNKAGQVRAKRTQLEKLEAIEVPPDRQDSIRKFHFPQTKRSGHRVIQLQKMSKSYPGVQVYKEFDFEITRGEKAVLVGENGAGKSTLLKILSGTLDIDNGKRMVGHNVDIGYFSQTRMDVLNPMSNVFEEAYNACSGSLPADTIRTILAAFFFVGDDVEKPVTVLSGGEKSRLILAKLLINPPNFLLLDEPTTHLDVDAVEALIKALKDYNGTLVCISHDIHFVRSVANTVYEVNQGRVRKFPGTFDYYWNKAKDLPTVVDIPTELTKPDETEPLKSDEDGEKRIKEHNEKVAKKIRKLRKESEKLEIDRSAKLRIIENPRHGAGVIQQYKSQLKEIEEKIHKIDIEIKRLKQSFKQP